MASAGAAERAGRAGFGEPQVVSRAATVAQVLEHEPEPSVGNEFDQHLETAFDRVDRVESLQDAAPDEPQVTRFQGGALDLGALQSHWAAFTEVVRGSKAMLAHCLSEGQPHSLQDGILGIGFSEEHAFHLNLMREASTQRELERQIERFFGTRLKVSLGDAAQPVAPQDERANARLTPEDVAASRREAAQDALDQTPRLQEILDTFDGEILEDNQAGPEDV